MPPAATPRGAVGDIVRIRKLEQILSSINPAQLNRHPGGTVDLRLDNGTVFRDGRTVGNARLNAGSAMTVL